MTKNRVAVVTGAASGIGAAISERLSEDGLTVASIDLSEADAAKNHGNLFIQADVTDPISVQAAMDSILDRFGHIDVLVNNAGITGSAEATLCHTTPVEEWDRVMAVNVRGIFLCSRAVLPSMVENQTGHIITTASIAGLVPFPNRCAYTASKGAAVQFAKSLARDYAPYGIRSNAVCPGMVETPMTQWRLDQPDLRSQVEARIPMGRVAKPGEIADAVSLLASDRLGYMTGNLLVVDGGWTVS